MCEGRLPQNRGAGAAPVSGAARVFDRQGVPGGFTLRPRFDETGLCGAARRGKRVGTRFRCGRYTPDLVTERMAGRAAGLAGFGFAGHEVGPPDSDGSDAHSAHWSGWSEACRIIVRVRLLEPAVQKPTRSGASASGCGRRQNVVLIIGSKSPLEEAQPAIVASMGLSCTAPMFSPRRNNAISEIAWAKRFRNRLARRPGQILLREICESRAPSP